MFAGQLIERWATAMNENPAPGGSKTPIVSGSISLRRKRGWSSRCRAGTGFHVRGRIAGKNDYEVIGVTLQLYDHRAAVHRKGSCLRRTGHS